MSAQPTEIAFAEVLALIQAGKKRLSKHKNMFVSQIYAQLQKLSSPVRVFGQAPLQLRPGAILPAFDAQNACKVSAISQPSTNIVTLSRVFETPQQAGRQAVLIAKYETKLIPRALLKQRLHEWGELLQNKEVDGKDE